MTTLASPTLATEQSPDFTCTLARRATMYDTLKSLPASFRAQVDHNLAPMSDRYGAFNPIDVIVKTAPSRRFIRAGDADGRHFVWYEQGGIAYWKQIVLFEPSGTIIQSRAAPDADLCAQTDQLLAGGQPVR